MWLPLGLQEDVFRPEISQKDLQLSRVKATTTNHLPWSLSLPLIGASIRQGETQEPTLPAPETEGRIGTPDLVPLP